MGLLREHSGCLGDCLFTSKTGRLDTLPNPIFYVIKNSLNCIVMPASINVREIFEWGLFNEYTQLCE